MHDAESHRVVDCRADRIAAGRHRSANSQIAQLQRSGIDERHVNRRLDAADLVAFGCGKLQHVIARRERRAGRECQRRRHTRAGGRHLFRYRLALHHAAGAVGDHVRHGHALGSGVCLTDLSVNQQLDPGRIRPLKIEADDAQRKRGQRERAHQRGGSRCEPRAGRRPLRCLPVSGRRGNRRTRPDGEASSCHLDAQPKRLATWKVRADLHTKQVVPRELRFNAIEGGLAGIGDGKQCAASGARQGFEAIGTDSSVRASQRDWRARAGAVEDAIVQLERVDARARGRRQRPERCQTQPGIVVIIEQREPFGHQHQRFRGVDRLEAGQEVSE